MRKLQIIISACALLIALIHIIWPGLTIDAVTLTLLMIAVVPWLVPLFKSVELPGGWKFEFQELKKAEKKIEKAGLLASVTVIGKTPEYSFQMVAEEDPKLALAGLRIEIEKRLKDIAEISKICSSHLGIGALLQTLSQNKILSDEECSVLADMIGMLNNAVHGMDVDYRAAKWAIDVGPRILKGLDERIRKK